MNSYQDLQVGFKIRKMRELKNLTRAQVAAELGLAERSYADVENENSSITLERLFDISKIFGCELCDLLEFSAQNAFSFYVNNNGNKGHNINHQGATNEAHLIQQLLTAKDEIIASKDAHIASLRQKIAKKNNKV